jgi:hypothetical protein
MCTRLATIFLVIFTLVFDSRTSPLHCQVRALFPHLLFFPLLTCHHSKPWVQASWVSIPLALAASYERALPPDLLCLGPFLRESELSFAIDCTSHVGFQCFCVTAIFQEYMLMALSSVAIWNKNKVIMAFTAIVWVTNISLQLRSEFPPCISFMASPDEHD